MGYTAQQVYEALPDEVLLSKARIYSIIEKKLGEKPTKSELEKIMTSLGNEGKLEFEVIHEKGKPYKSTVKQWRKI